MTERLLPPYRPSRKFEFIHRPFVIRTQKNKSVQDAVTGKSPEWS